MILFLNLFEKKPRIGCTGLETGCKPVLFNFNYKETFSEKKRLTSPLLSCTTPVIPSIWSPGPSSCKTPQQPTIDLVR